MLNQGAVEQIFVDHLGSKNIHIERYTEAKSLHCSPNAGRGMQQFPVNVGVRRGDDNGMQSLHGPSFERNP